MYGLGIPPDAPCEVQLGKGEGKWQRSYGTFYRVVPLPEGVMTDSAKATLKDGVLEVIMQAPPHEVRRGRQIEIGEGGRTPQDRQQGSGQQK